MQVLKECPFDGGEASLTKERPEGRYTYDYVVECSSCSARVIGMNDKEAIEIWNRRIYDSNT